MFILDTPAQTRAISGSRSERIAEARAAALAKEIASNTISVNIDDEHNCSSLDERIGKPLMTSEVIRRLKLCNSRLVCERSINFPEMTGIYIDKDEQTEAGAWVTRKVFLFTLSSGDIMPEFEVAHVTFKQVPNPEVVNATSGQEVPRDACHWIMVPTVYDLTRGWRTVLIRLLRAGLINRHDVETHFGWAPSVDSQNWALLT